MRGPAACPSDSDDGVGLGGSPAADAVGASFPLKIDSKTLSTIDALGACLCLDFDADAISAEAAFSIAISLAAAASVLPAFLVLAGDFCRCVPAAEEASLEPQFEATEAAGTVLVLDAGRLAGFCSGCADTPAAPLADLDTPPALALAGVYVFEKKAAKRSYRMFLPSPSCLSTFSSAAS